MLLGIFLFILAVVSIPGVALPGAGGLAALAIVAVGWVVIDQLDQLIEIAGQTRDMCGYDCSTNAAKSPHSTDHDCHRRPLASPPRREGPL
jgi:hypothetical protein